MERTWCRAVPEGMQHLLLHTGPRLGSFCWRRQHVSCVCYLVMATPCHIRTAHLTRQTTQMGLQLLLLQCKAEASRALHLQSSEYRSVEEVVIIILLWRHNRGRWRRRNVRRWIRDGSVIVDISPKYYAPLVATAFVLEDLLVEQQVVVSIQEKQLHSYHSPQSSSTITPPHRRNDSGCKRKSVASPLNCTTLLFSPLALLLKLIKRRSSDAFYIKTKR